MAVMSLGFTPEGGQNKSNFKKPEPQKLLASYL